MAEAWRNERLINHFRTALFGTAVVFGGIATYFLLGRPHAAIPMIGGWTIFIAVFNATWFKRNFHPAVPWLLSAGEIALIGSLRQALEVVEAVTDDLVFHAEIPRRVRLFREPIAIRDTEFQN